LDGIHRPLGGHSPVNSIANSFKTFSARTLKAAPGFAGASAEIEELLAALISKSGHVAEGDLFRRRDGVARGAGIESSFLTSALSCQERRSPAFAVFEFRIIQRPVAAWFVVRQRLAHGPDLHHGRRPELIYRKAILFEESIS
jgi:hypothetical protein